MCGPVEKFNKSAVKGVVGAMHKKQGKKPSSTASASKASAPKGGRSSAVRKSSVNVGGSSASPSTTIKKRKSTVNTGSNSGGSSGVGANLNVQIYPINNQESKLI